MVALVGVQSNQYPRALDIARPFRDAGVPVVIGGFHVSGCLSMLDGRAVDLDACRDMGVSIFAGEAEGRLDAVLRDAAAGRLAPRIQFHRRTCRASKARRCRFCPSAICVERSALAPASTPAAAAPISARSAPSSTCRAASRATARPDDVEHLVRLNWAQGVHKFFITDDNFARNKEWEAIFDRLIELREQRASRSA